MGACSQGSIGTREDISLSLGLKGITQPQRQVYKKLGD